jgi:hypothetical protein
MSFLYLIIKPILDDVAMFHVFNASLSGRDDTIKCVLLMAAKMNIYYAAKETMTEGLLE